MAPRPRPSPTAGSDLGGALAALRAEAEAAGAPLRSLLYSGFRPLVLRQVIFGMIKFFTFDFVVGAVLEVAPQLGDSAPSPSPPARTEGDPPR